jgi:hypothetical protein
MNARQEFIDHINKIKQFNKEIKVTSAIIVDKRQYKTHLIFVLKPNYSEDEYNKFLEEINLFIYNSGFGWQELYGYIWYNDGSWSERAEYDGSEWWEYKKCPSFQDKLNEFKLNNKND